jgi:hypothetical protein
VRDCYYHLKKDSAIWCLELCIQPPGLGGKNLIKFTIQGVQETEFSAIGSVHIKHIKYIIHARCEVIAKVLEEETLSILRVEIS